ncbi:MAG: hypothetical protein JXR73_04800 [Candidatus Omnitrophica bacterium]|nr:hypothetical protein [Candidatus Omnitrophota bacterium]
MKKYLLFIALLSFLAGASYGQELDINQWPPNTDFDADVHFWAADDFLMDAIPAGTGDLFDPALLILTGGDQGSEDVTIAGLPAKKSVANYFNVADELYFLLPDLPVIDVLVLYFANAESKRDNLGFLLGTLPGDKYLHTLTGYTFESVTDQYEWRLFRLDNSGAWAGNVYDDSEGTTTYGGVNGGTIRFQQTNGLIFRAVAFGPEGAFGEPEEINTAKEVEFNPDEYEIMAEWDINNGVINGLDVYRVTGGDQEIVESADIGPADDKRQAIRPAIDDGTDATQDIYVNWEILNEHFGPTSQPSARFKIVAEYYDDPALAGTIFGPEVYVTAGDSLQFFPEANRTTLEGSGQWREAMWYVTDVKLKGVNVPTQAAARFTFGGPVYISRLRLGIIRTAGIYENVDPIPDVYIFDPDPYGIYAELDLDKGVVDNLDVGNSGGDQEYIIEDNIGPAGDQRKALRPALGDGGDPFDRFVNFSILNEVFGPSNQPNAVLKVAVDYYDDPNLVDERFGPEVYQSNVFGTLQFKFFPSELRMTLEGSGEWKTAVWQIDDVNFTGVNQGPQAAVRFWFTDNGAIYISRVRYAVIRPVGVNAGVDMLAEYEPIVRVSAWELY